MNPVDLGVIAVVGLSAVFAFARGFVREALSIVAWVGAGFATLYGFNYVYAIVDPIVHNPLLSQLIAGFGLFVGALIVLTILTGILARAVHAAPGLSPIDRTLGFIFGLLRGAFIVCLAYLLLDVSVQKNDRPVWLRDAKSEPYLQQGADLLKNLLPESLRMKGAAAADEVIKTVSPAVEAEKAMRALSNPSAPPAPAAAAQPSPAPAYKPNDQRAFDRLINNQR